MVRPIRSFRSLGVACALAVFAMAAPARGDEVWVAPTQQQDLGGLGIGSNVVWPATPIGAVRLAWGVPDDLQSFQSAKLVLIPHAPAGPATLSVFVCRAQNSDLVGAACTGPAAYAFNGVANRLIEVDVSAAVGAQVGAAGLNYLAVLAYTTPTTTTDHIVGLRFAYTPELPSGVATLGANTFSGTQTAPAFSGDGSALTNLPVPPGVATLGANSFSGTQTAPAFVGNGSGLTNLPFPAGAATLGANTFSATQTVNTGNLDLDPSTATTGNITKNGVRFLHNVGVTNTFLGLEAGTLTTTGSNDTAVGKAALSSNTNGSNNTAVGALALLDNTSGGQNTATGSTALASNTMGGANTGTGWAALQSNSIGLRNTADGHAALISNTGSNNTAVGASALLGNTTGGQNVAVGDDAGVNATTGSNNIYLGASVQGVAGESNAIYLGVQGTQTKTVIAGIRGTSVTGGDPVVIDASGRLGTGAVSPGANTVGTSEVINDSLTASDLAANSVGTSEVAFNYAASASEGGAASDLACVGCVAATEVSFAFATPGANTFTATQTINGGNLDLDHSTPTTGSITMNGTRFLHDFGIGNTFVGGGAGNFTMTGGSNTASGSNALLFNTTGGANTASGVSALRFNTAGNNNTAAGAEALNDNTSGSNNTASGNEALESNTTGNNNVALGFGAGANATTGSNNIYLGANVAGVAGEANTMYIGGTGIQTRAFIAGVRGTTVPGPAIPVLVDIFGQLGTAFSSRRYKEDIHTMADASRRLLQLRPVTFRYKQAYRDGSKPIQFGLIAEEVAEVFPELVVSNAEGETETVHYETLNVLLLNELQKQQQRIETLEQKLNELLVSRR